MFFITGALLRVVLVISLNAEFSTAYENLNKKMFGRYGPLMTDLVEVHGRDPHLPAHPPPHPPLAGVAVKLYCATLHRRLQSCKPFRMQQMKMPFPSAERLLDHHPCFGVSVIVGFLCCVSCWCVWCHQERAARVPTVPKKDTIVEGTMVDLQMSTNVTCTKHVTMVSASRPAGNDVGEHSFK